MVHETCVFRAARGPHESEACGDNESKPEAFSLRFAAVAGGAAVGCTDDLGGFGPAKTDRVGINDLRFYVSNLAFADEDGKPVEYVLDSNAFQLTSAAGSVALIDLTGNSQGSCSTTSVAYAEGTARTNDKVTGTTSLANVAKVTFDVGVSQPMMKSTISASSPEGAPSPLNEMYWNWNLGYRHFVLNFAVKNGAGATGEGYLHVGSIGCAPDDGSNALTDRDACTFVNTPSVSLGDFDLTSDTIAVDLDKLFAGIDFVAPIRDPETFEEIGQGPGVECHSSPMQPDCPTVFASFGIDVATGAATASADQVFHKR